MYDRVGRASVTHMTDGQGHPGHKMGGWVGGISIAHVMGSTGPSTNANSGVIGV